jgi:hypothetical protein
MLLEVIDRDSLGVVCSYVAPHWHDMLMERWDQITPDHLLKMLYEHKMRDEFLAVWNTYPVGESLWVVWASKDGDLPLVIRLLESGCPWNEIAYDWAEQNNHQHLVRWFTYKGLLPRRFQRGQFTDTHRRRPKWWHKQRNKLR